VVLGRAAEASSTMQALLRAVLTGLLLLPPTFLMGGTLPAMCRAWIRRDATLGRDLGFLYAFNTLGAAVGSLLAGFVLLARFGLHRVDLRGGRPEPAPVRMGIVACAG